jgi:hypothetical protein
VSPFPLRVCSATLVLSRKSNSGLTLSDLLEVSGSGSQRFGQTSLKLSTVIGMANYIRVHAIERLKEQVEFGGGIATQEPPIVSTQADYLVALSSGLSLDEIKIHRVVPLAVFVSNDLEIDLFEKLVNIVINDLVPTLDASFFSVPLAEIGSIGWRPTTRTNKRYTAKEWSESEVIIARNSHQGVSLAREMHTAHRSILESAQKRVWDATISGSLAELKAAKADLESTKSELEVKKAEYEMIKAKYESHAAMIDAFSKIAQLMLRIAGSCALIIGSLHIFAPHTQGSSSADKTIHILIKSASETHANWTAEISEVLKKLAEELDSGKSE